MPPTLNLYDQENDPAPSIRGYVYQLLHAVNIWLGLDDNCWLGVEYADDLSVIKQESIESFQTKHSKRKISLTSLEVQKFLARSYRVWRDKNGLSAHCFLTTSTTRRENDRSRSWIEQLQQGDFNCLVVYLKNKNPKLGQTDLANWKKMIQEPDNNLCNFLRAIKIKTSQTDYLALQQKVLDKIKNKYPDKENPQRLLEKLLCALLLQASEKGIKLFNKVDLGKAICQVDKENTDAMKKTQDLLAEGVIEVIEQALYDHNPQLAIDMESTLLQNTNNPEIKARLYNLLGRAYEVTENLNEAKTKYIKAREHASQKDDKLYLKARQLLCNQDTVSTKQASDIANKLVRNNKQSWRGYYLQLRCKILGPDIIAKSLPDRLHKNSNISLMLSIRFYDEGQIDKAIYWVKRSEKTLKPTISKAFLINYEVLKLGFKPHTNPHPALKIKNQFEVYIRELKEIWTKMEAKSLSGPIMQT